VGVNFKRKATELVQAIKKYNHILVYIKGSPDPDVMAASYVFKLICEFYGIKSTIDSPVLPSLPQNIKIVKDLNLPIQFESLKGSVKLYDAYAILDNPTVEVSGVTGVLPCVVHIDHHEPVMEDIPVEFKFIRTDAGSTSTLMAILMNHLKDTLTFSNYTTANASTALYFGIQTDTNDFQYQTELDKNAVSSINPFLDRPTVERISSIKFPKKAMYLLQQALHHQFIHNEWLIAGVGFIKEKQRDIMAIISDFLLKREDISKVVVFSIVEKKNGLTLDASFRTNIPTFNLAKLIKRITSEGGGRPFKGAFQVNLDYFIHCPDRDLLWKLVYLTTVEALKKEGLGVKMNIFKRSWHNLKEKISNLV
jgi:nanoRNase/pAp phosphatase (c-di-AMP/oligoRNAs hydrolase)